MSDEESPFIALPGWLLNSLTFCMLLEWKTFAIIHFSCISLEVSSLTSTEGDLMYGLQKIIALCHSIKLPMRDKYGWGKPFKMKLLIASFIVLYFLGSILIVYLLMMIFLFFMIITASDPILPPPLPEESVLSDSWFHSIVQERRIRMGSSPSFIMPKSYF